jgi:hypothetical protein
MLARSLKSKQAGTFTISPGKEVHGELTLAGAKTSLYLHDKEFFWTRDIRSMKGVLHDLTKVSLINCITPESGQTTRGKDCYYDSNIFPHFVIYGDYHIEAEEKTIAEIHFVIGDATTLFYDFDAFGSVIDSQPFIEQIANANGLDRQIKIGPNPHIQYFTGKREIFATDTVIGRISATHNPSYTLGGPEGVRLKNRIVITLAFKEAVIFEDPISSVALLLAYFGMLVGRPQNLLELSIRVQSDGELPTILGVYWSTPPKREQSFEARKPHPADVLMDGARKPEDFSSVMANWLERQQQWRDARRRFFGTFAEQRRYSLDRLIGSANMFDILPNSAVPPDVMLTEELKAAQSEARKIFRALPVCPERDSILGALGRLGKSTLKQKVRHQAQRLITAIGERLPDFLTVTDEAVNCRSYYVHGGDPRFDYSGNFNAVVFFIDTLEFVFAASDLIESGWNVRAWSEIPTCMSHPFGRYRVNYIPSLQNLKALLPLPAKND